MGLNTMALRLVQLFLSAIEKYRVEFFLPDHILHAGCVQPGKG
jgi:hypothetical protein